MLQALPGGMVGLEQGEGIPLLLVHGSLCDYRYWSAQLAALSANWRVLVPSLRGCYPAGAAQGFSTAQHLEDLCGLVEAQGEPVCVLGHSRGGNLALRLTAARPQHVRALVLADPGGDYDAHLFGATEPVADIDSGGRNRFRQEALALIEAGACEAGLQHFIDTVSGEGIWQRSSARFRHMALDNVDTLAAMVADVPAPIDAEVLAAVCCPVLLLGGERSPAPFPQILAMLATHWPEARLERLPGVSHGMSLQRPAGFNRLVDEFLRGVCA
ncbi:alpha/beta hydrolase [Pseudomonas sp. NW5]|uniref:alpha/beta fold hydrolase n=1 Tax=Pseudomonas sp. NW5 TaxID=2934934 RepID=UPI002020CA49|nr:alpha/beta hydrolase [Pseudomonas sp. NW5]MCL7463340.1 alpha/beta hydrolase [Pseudomonas sp. NW5]